jgi:hypothetical protein
MDFFPTQISETDRGGANGITLKVTGTAPEPGTLALFGLGAVALAARLRKRRG